MRPSAIAQYDQIALRLEQAAGALLGFLQFPVSIRHRFIVQGDLAQLLAHQPEPEAQSGERDAGDREQETDADREGCADHSRRLPTGFRL